MKVGEGHICSVHSGDYAANVEAVTIPRSGGHRSSSIPAAESVATLDCPTIDQLIEFANGDPTLSANGRTWTAADTLKNVIVMLQHADGSESPLVMGVPGDRAVDEKRLEAAVAPATVRAFDENDAKRYPALVPGYIGPQVLGEESESGIRYVVDPRVVVGSPWLTGANAATSMLSMWSPAGTSRPTAQSRRPRYAG